MIFPLENSLEASDTDADCEISVEDWQFLQ